MAIQQSFDAFNPGQKQVEPGRYGNDSRAAEDPKLISGAGELFKDAGKIISSAAKATDEFITTLATNEATNTFYPEREKYAAVVAGARQGILGNQQAVQQPMVADADILPGQSQIEGTGDQKPLPPDIQAFQSQAAGLGAARANGKISETEFYASMATKARNIRSHYGPAYAPVIDKTTSDILGVDPANAFIKSAIADINTFQTGQQAQLNHYLNLLGKEASDGTPGASQVWQQLQKTGAAGIPGALKWLENTNAWQSQAKRIKSNLETLKAANGINEETATEGFKNSTSGVISSFFTAPEAMADMAGMTQEQKDAPTSAANAEMRVQAMTRQRSMAEAYLRKTASEDGTLKTLGQAKTEALITDQLKPFDVSLGLATNDKYGTVGQVARWNEALKMDTKYALSTMFGNYSTIYRVGEAMKDLPSWIGDVSKEFIGQKVFDDATKGFGITMRGMLTAQINPDGTPRNPGQPFTFNKAFETAKENNFATPANLEFLIKTVDGAGGFLDPAQSPGKKEGIARAIFSPGNLGFISNLAPAQQMQVFKRLTSPDVAEQAYKLGPNVFPMYRNWVEQTFGKEIAGKEIRDLNVIQGNRQFALTWDEKHNLWGLQVKDVSGKVIDSAALDTDEVYTQGASRQPIVEGAVLTKARTSLRQLNLALSSVSNITTYAKDFDTSKYLMHVLTQSGYNIDPEGKYGDLRDKMTKAIMKSREDIKSEGAKWGVK